ncbi:MAG: DUF4040 domain-containing protein [Spirochaetia bacterium]|jgi:uncharacterized MnhB-related membrane protein|nr:DUF4040 domain-containing protein [Spirochaetia bacterium]
MLSLIIMISLSVLILASAILAVQTKNLVVAVIAAGLVSLMASIGYLLLAAPDVAMTEAAIGSGLSTIIFFYVLNRVRGRDNG